jgi:cobalt-zinc-cadmium efflux system membrane fusion protein
LVVLVAVLASGAVIAVIARGRSAKMTSAAAHAASTSKQSRVDDRPLLQRAIGSARVERAVLARDIQVVGSVSPAEDHFALVGPSVSGRVMRLRAGIGDQVRKGQILGEIESVEAGQAMAEYVAANAAFAAARANAVRERQLAALQISSNRAWEVAEARAVVEQAKLRAAEAHLHAIGLDAREVKALERETEHALIPMRAPIRGTVIKRTVTMGQSIGRSTDVFTIADLSHLWVQLDVYERDLERVHAGQNVNLRTDSAPGEVFPARVAYVGPIIDETTRTGHVRVEFENTQGVFRLNQLVAARIIGDAFQPGEPVLAVPRSALQRVDGKPIVFVRRRDGFEKRVVQPGSSGGDLIEVRSGLRENEEVATDGAIALERELLR